MADSLHTTNPVALQALMSETLFIPKTPQQELTSVEEFIYQGDKSTGVLFILRYPDYPYFSPAAEEAFLKTIGALQLHAGNVAVVNLANSHNPNDWKRIMAFFQPKKITLLGVEPISLGLPAIAHNSYMHGKIATVFNTFSFEEMFADVQKKKMFWMEFKSFMG
ncbi:hypothetical protein [Sphingobacterium sp. 1.A.4]|uniref:hypothetical protein n=1 Tax=Sphingobacterium sp. 1.A.4 TaxID=2044603 RepID=UPI000C0BBB45|nr:hypothetical protein [Sphingobacterium sp. 1.A.4]